MTDTLLNDNLTRNERIQQHYAISRQRKREMGPFAGLHFFERSGHSIAIVYRHWPHLLCWSWALNWSSYRGPVVRRFFSLRRVWDDGGWYLDLLWLGRLDFLTQDYDWMLRDKQLQPTVKHKP